MGHYGEMVAAAGFVLPSFTWQERLDFVE